MADVRNGLQVVRSLVQIGGLERAHGILSGDLGVALWFNLERYDDYLTLVRAYFPDGWTKPPKGLDDKSSLGIVADNAAEALASVGRVPEALAAGQHAIATALREPDLSGLGVGLWNHCGHQLASGHIEAAERALLLVEELATLGHDAMVSVMAPVLRFNYSIKVGKYGDAETALGRFNSIPRPKAREVYRLGDAES